MRILTIGEMAEWSIAAVLKTVEGHTSGGSNPSLSAELTGQKWSVNGQKATNQRFVAFFIARKSGFQDFKRGSADFSGGLKMSHEYSVIFVA